MHRYKIKQINSSCYNSPNNNKPNKMRLNNKRQEYSQSYFKITRLQQINNRINNNHSRICFKTNRLTNLKFKNSSNNYKVKLNK